MIGAGLVRFCSPSQSVKSRLVLMSIFLIVLTLGGWVALLLAARSHPLLLGLGVLAFGLGLRHAVDPDHIAAIDSTTRKLMQDQKPVGVGFFFSLGHSTVVAAMTLVVAVSATFVHNGLPRFEAAGSLIGTAVSSLFLLMLGIANLIVLLEIVKLWRRVTDEGHYSPAELTGYLDNRGLLARLFRPLLRVVTQSWHMYPVGFLFGLGFDTASEVALLAVAATTGASGMPVRDILLLPLLFAAGMAVVDTADGVLTLRAYGWAYIKPVRKLYYNMFITLISGVVALSISGVEGLQMAGRAGWRAGILRMAGGIQLENLGYVIIAVFLIGWIGSVALYRIRDYDRFEPAEIGR